ncbi:hypothetical protein NPN24_27160, partial [Vibrio parahaemolyticus]|nr:hypothetical protein [Vibrio parahaemolyticus]
MRGKLITTTLVMLLAAGAASAQTAKATLKDAKGGEVGTADIVKVNEGVLIKLSLKGLPPGEHTFHI